MEHLEEAKEIFSQRLTFEELKKFNLVQLGKLVVFGRKFYQYLSEIKTNGKAYHFGLSELQIGVLIETTLLNVIDLTNVQSDIEKFQLIAIDGIDNYIHLN